MKALLNYIDGQLPSDAYTTELDAAVQSARHNERWRHDYMTLEMIYQEKYEQGEAAGYKRGVECGIEQGIEKGLEQGLEKGLKQGVEKGSLLKAKQTATALLSNGKLSLSEIAECSGLSIKQVEELKEILDRTNFQSNN